MSAADSRLRLRSRLGALTLVLLCAVQFLDIVDSAIVNVALPSIQRSLHFSQQNLQWVASGYILTYGGFLLLGGRLGDLLGRRRMLLTGVDRLRPGVADRRTGRSSGLLVAARLVQGIGAALMAPAALSELTTSFREGKDRNTALGAWGAISGIAAAAGVFLGGLLSQGPGWRWVFFVNPADLCPRGRRGAGAASQPTAGAGSQSLDVRLAGCGPGDRRACCCWSTRLVRAPRRRLGIEPRPSSPWPDRPSCRRRSCFNELRSRNPLVPLAILRVRGLVAADLTQLIAFAGFFSMFFYATLYMQEVLHYSPLKAGAAYLPITAGFAVAGGVASQLITRVGTRPVVVAGCADRRGRDLLRVAGAAARLLRRRSASGVPRDVARGGIGLRLDRRRRQRRRPARQGGPGGGTAQLLPAGRQRPRPRHPVRRGDHPHQRPDRGQGIATVVASDAGYHQALLVGQHPDGSAPPSSPCASATPARRRRWSWSTRTSQPSRCHDRLGPLATALS